MGASADLIQSGSGNSEDIGNGEGCLVDMTTAPCAILSISRAGMPPAAGDKIPARYDAEPSAKDPPAACWVLTSPRDLKYLGRSNPAVTRAWQPWTHPPSGGPPG